jgi:hypothetical protein
MTTLIALPDLHDKSEHLKRIGKALYEVDAVLLVGDMTNGSMQHLLRLLAILEDFNEHIYAIPGNMDTAAMVAHLTREGVSVHRSWQMLDGMAVCGMGGALPFAGEYVFSEAEFAQYLPDTVQGLATSTPKILLCHQPPYGTLCDRLKSGQQVGSTAVRAFIEREQPLLCFSGHIHEAQGIDRIGATYIVNAGPLWQSNAYAYLEIEANTVKTLEIRQVAST